MRDEFNPVKHTDGRRGPSADLQQQIDDAIAARACVRHLKGEIGQTSAAHPDVAAISGQPNHRHESSTNEPGIPPSGAQYEYLDHPADVVLHSWGVDFPTALANIALAMFGYFTCLESVSFNEEESVKNGGEIIAQGHDKRSLVYAFLDEWLFNFHDTGFIAKEIQIIECNASVWRIRSCGKGEIMDVSRHPQGTEVKAITYSGMRIDEEEGRCDVFVVVDI